jgi:hypothetical protein
VTMLVVASSNSVAPGTLGFIVVFGMAVVLFFLFRSMSRHLRKVNAAASRDKAADPSQPGEDPAGPGDGREDARPGARP